MSGLFKMFQPDSRKCWIINFIWLFALIISYGEDWKKISPSSNIILGCSWVCTSFGWTKKKEKRSGPIGRVRIKMMKRKPEVPDKKGALLLARIWSTGAKYGSGPYNSSTYK